MAKIYSLHSDDFYRRKASECYEEAKRHIANKNYENAAKAFEQAGEFDPMNAEYFYYAGIYNYLAQRVDRSLSYLKKAATISPDEMEFQFAYGEVLYETKEYKKAEEIFKIVTEGVGNHIDAMIYLGKCALKQKRHDYAIELLNGVIIVDPNNYEAYFELGCAYLGIHNYDKAEEIFKRSIERNQTYIIAHYFLSKIYLKKGQHDLAIDILNQLKEKCPEENELVEKNITAIRLVKEL